MNSKNDNGFINIILLSVTLIILAVMIIAIIFA